MGKKYKIPSSFTLYFYSGKPGWFLYDPPYQMYHILWRFHKNDVDDIISIPHGDSIDAKQKYQLNPYDGKVYRGKNEVGTISKKEFIRLWTDNDFLKLANEARDVYLLRHPNATLPEIPIVKNRRRKKEKNVFIDNQESKIVLEQHSDYQIAMETAISKKDS